MALLILENHQGLPASGAVDSLTGHVPTPLRRGRSHVDEVVEIGALEETLPGVGHAAFHLGLVLGMTWARRIGDETPMLGIFQKASGLDFVQKLAEL